MHYWLLYAGILRSLQGKVEILLISSLWNTTRYDFSKHDSFPFVVQLVSLVILSYLGCRPLLLHLLLLAMRVYGIWMVKFCKHTNYQHKYSVALSVCLPPVLKFDREPRVVIGEYLQFCVWCISINILILFFSCWIWNVGRKIFKKLCNLNSD